MRLSTGLAFIAGVAVASTLAAMGETGCVLQLTGLDAERIAREGKTDAAFYDSHPGHFQASAITIVHKGNSPQ